MLKEDMNMLSGPMDILTGKAVSFSVKISVLLDLLRAGPLPKGGRRWIKVLANKAYAQCWL